MADLTITAANVVPAANAVKTIGVAGETVTAGQPLYYDTTVSQWKKADNNAAAAASHRASGISLTGSSLNQPVVVQTGGDITIGATIVAGDPYYLSATAGGVCPKADLATGMSVCLLGLAKSASLLALDFQFPGVTL